MSAVDLTDQEWTQVMGILGDAPWKIAHPLLMKIGNQLQQQASIKRYAPPAEKSDGADMEVQDERAH